MKDSVILEGKIYISAKRAAKIINYAQDYIGQLCRAGKLDCKMIGRSWFVTEESLLAHRADAIDNTQERVLKVIKNNDVAIKETIKAVVDGKKNETPVAPIASPVSTPAPVLSPIQNTGFKYEAENKSFLPELRKKVPAAFELPKNVLKLSPAPMVAPQPRIQVRPSASVAVAHANPISTTMIVALLALGGFFFTLSIATLSNSKSLSYNEASVASATSNLVSEILRAVGLKRSPVPLATIERDKIVTPVNTPGETAGELNGISIFPAVSPTEDELAKQKIMSSFSDEVKISRDKDGTSGVITPVFKKTDGNEFVYVMVPVKEQKTQE